jgi:hypothetical protein
MTLMSRSRRHFSLLFLATLLAGNLVAQQMPTASPASPTHAAKSSATMPGVVTQGVYHNPSLAFSYKIPFGWVDRTAEMREGDSSDKTTDSSKGQVLLAVFERPPEAKGNTINSAVVIAAESISSYPGMRNAADYFAPLEEVTAAKGFKVVNEPYEFATAGKPLARADFAKELESLTMHQASLVTLQKGYVLSFSFLAGTDDQVEDLIGGLQFAAAKASRNVPNPALKK